jgi:hypothetical protein
LLTFPNLYIQIMLTIMLLILGLQSAKKGVQITKKENLAMALVENKNKPKPIFKIKCMPGSVVPQCVNVAAQKSEIELQAEETIIDEEPEPMKEDQVDVIWIGETAF